MRPSPHATYEAWVGEESSAKQYGDKAHLSEVGSVSLTGGLGGSNLVGSSGTGGSSKGDVGSGTSDLVGLGVGLDLGDRDTSVGVGVDVDNLGVGKTGVLVGVDVEQVSLNVSSRPFCANHRHYEKGEGVG